MRSVALSVGVWALFLAALPGCVTQSATKSAIKPLAKAPQTWKGEVAASGVEVIAKLEQTPGNIAVSPDGRIFLSLHPFGAPSQRVVEVTAEGTKPYPNAQWSKAVGEDGVGIEGIIGIRCGADGVLWMLDTGSARHQAKLVAWDTRAEKLHKVIEIGRATTPRSFVQDLAIDPERERIYIADCGLGDLSTPPEPAMIVVNTRSGSATRVLQQHPSFMPQASASMVIDGTEVRAVNSAGQAFAPRVGLNPITIDATNTLVYFGAMHGTQVWSIPAAVLAKAGEANSAKAGATDELLASAIKLEGSKGVSDGISIDSAGNVYVTDVANNAIGVLEARRASDGSRPYRILAQDATYLSWADGISMGPDGKAYVVVNQLHKHAALHAGVAANNPPYFVVRVTPLARGEVGR